MECHIELRKTPTPKMAAHDTTRKPISRAAFFSERAALGFTSRLATAKRCHRQRALTGSLLFGSSLMPSFTVRVNDPKPLQHDKHAEQEHRERNDRPRDAQADKKRLGLSVEIPPHAAILARWQ